MSSLGSRIGTLLLALVFVALGSFQYRADILATLSCDASMRATATVEKHQTTMTAAAAADAAGPDYNYLQSLPFLPKEDNVSLAESFRDNTTVVYLFHQRKAGGSSLRKFLFEEYAAVVGRAQANATSYVPCHVQSCQNWDPNPRQQFIGQKRLLAGHLSVTTAAARAVYGEKQVLLSNFRDPIERIESCIKFRFPKEATKRFEDSNFNVTQVTDFFLTKPDADGDTCLGEPFRMLSPFNPDEVVTDEGIQQVCDFAKTYVHMVNFGVNATSPTKIEKELEIAGTKYNLNKAKLNKKTDNFVANMKAFKDHIRGYPVVQSELKLYDCVSRD